MVNFCANALHKEVLPVPGGPEGKNYGSFNKCALHHMQYLHFINFTVLHETLAPSCKK